MRRLLLAALVIASSGGLHAQGFALQFDGLNDKVTIPDDSGDLDLGSYLTLEAWIRPSVVDEWSEPIIEGSVNYVGSGILSWGLNLNRGGDWYCPIVVSSPIIFYPVGQITPGEWHHLACSYDGSTIRYYQNGLPIGSQVLPRGGPTLDVVGVTLGASPYEHFKGIIDQVSVWSTVRSASEIDFDSLGCIGETSMGLMGLWKMDDGDLQAVTDSSGNNNHGWLGSHGGNQDSDPSWIVSNAPYVCAVFFDGFESGDTLSWSAWVPHCSGDSDCGEDEFCKMNGCDDLIGFCKLTTGFACIAIWDPVCGCDGVTYSNACYAEQAGVNIASIGECPP